MLNVGFVRIHVRTGQSAVGSKLCQCLGAADPLLVTGMR